jgi:hypothetical protein
MTTDFVIVSYNKIDYARLCVESIDRYWKGIDYTIYVVVNYVDEESEMKLHYDLFKYNKNVVIIKGEDQSSTTQVGPNGEFTQTVDRVGYVDGCKIASGSWYGAWATNIGIKSGKGKYVCVLDQDTIFLDSYATKLIELADQFAFVGNRWCPGSVFETPICKGTCDGTWDDGMVRPMLSFAKREFYDNIEKEKYVEKKIWRSSPWNCDYRDMAGNLTWHAKQKGLKYLVLKNSYRDRFRKDNGLWKQHLLDIPYGEQAWINDTPVFFHATRGGYRNNQALERWVKEAKKHLGID